MLEFHWDMSSDTERANDPPAPNEPIPRTPSSLVVKIGRWWRDRWQRLLESPGWKTFILATGTAAIGVLSSAFVVQISSPEGLLWRSFFRASSFYLLVGLILIIGWFQRTVYRHETRIRQFLDTDFCISYMRSKCLPEAAERYKELIRSGDVGELTRAMDELRKVLQ